MAEDNDSIAAQRETKPIVDPTPARRKRLTDLLDRFFNDEVSMAELKGHSKEQLFSLAETGYIKFKHGRIPQAEKIYQALIVLDHRNAYFHAVMGAIHQKQKRPVEAILEFSRAVSLNKKDVASFVNRGELYLRHRNYRRAAEDFRQAIVLDASGANLWANRARSLVIALKCQMDANQAMAKRKRARTPARPRRK